MIVKQHIANDGRILLAICDSNLLNKTFEEDNKILDLTSEFYKGEEKNKEETIVEIKKAHIVHAIGEETINLLKELKLLTENNILIVQGIPHSEIIKE
jgi:uncharacterized protein